LPIIPNRCGAIKKAYCPKRFYRRRYKIENFFCRIKDWRRSQRATISSPQLPGRHYARWGTLLDQIV